MSMLLQHSINHATLITGFVFMMMVVIEYLNNISSGSWQRILRGGRWRQYLLASFLGATPGCLGAFAVVSLYLHREITLGALVAAMIATSGDESFIMLSMIPEQAPLILIILFLTGIAAGYLTDTLFVEKTKLPTICGHEFSIHVEETRHCFPWGHLRDQWKQCSPARGILSAILILFLFAVVSGHLGPDVWDWLKVTLVIVSSTALFIVATVPDHFLEKHLWNHVAKSHVPKVFLWTFGTLVLMHILVDHLHIEGWIKGHQLVVLLVACLVGLIPESGPHLMFLVLFTENTIPFSIFLASSIVQDGHGMLPLLAESRRDFLITKVINLAVGLLVGFIGYVSGY